MKETIVPTMRVSKAPRGTTIPTKTSEQRQLELEEAQNIAFQVVVFFIALIFASFGMLYIYHKME
jgi:hypothetical protein